MRGCARLGAMLLALLVGGPVAHADFYNQRNLLPGERAQMMGGAYTALSDDVSGAYYDPAGLAFASSSSLSASGTALTYASAKRRDYYPGVSQPLELAMDRFYAVPTSFGLSLRIIDGVTVALSMFEVDRTHLAQTGHLDGVALAPGGTRSQRLYSSYSRSLRLDTETDLLGVTLAFRLTPEIAIGLSMFYMLYQGSVGSDEVWNGAVGDYAALHASQEILAGGIVPTLGLQWRPHAHWRFGVALTLETLPTNSTNGWEIDYQSPTEGASHLAGSIRTDVRLPGKVAMGAAWSEPGRFTIALDAIVYFPLDYGAPREPFAIDDPTNRHREQPHADASLGVEWYVRPEWVLRAGIYTNTSGATADRAAERTDLYGGTFGCARVTRGMSVGPWIGFVYGASHADPVVAGDPAVSWERWQLLLGFGGTLQVLQ